MKVAESFFAPSHDDGGLCYRLLRAIKNFESGSWDAPILFPEFELLRPDKNESDSYWFYGCDANERRVLAMLLCYEMCKP